LAGMNFCLWMREPGGGNGELAVVAVVAERPGAPLVNNMVYSGCEWVSSSGFGSWGRCDEGADAG
jgi:hypothetical protein